MLSLATIVFSIIISSEAYTVEQLFICDLGYTTNGGEDIFLHTRCQAGLWDPDHTVDCQARVKCNGLWFERKFSAVQHKRTCYLLTRAKTWEHSRRWCWALDSDLISIADRNELTWLKSNIPNSRPDLSVIYGPMQSGIGYVWLGLSRFDEGLWHWVDDGTTPNFTWWPPGLATDDAFKHLAYADVGKDWMWYPSTNEKEDSDDYMYSMCKREADDSLTKSLPSLLSRLMLVREGSPLIVEIPGMRNMLTRYLMYEWGPIFLQSLYPTLSSSNYRKLINQLLTGNEETVNMFANISSVHDYRLIKLSPTMPRKPLLLYRCTIKEKMIGNCGFTMYVNRVGVDDISLFIRVSEAMSSQYSAIYRLEMPLIGFDEEIIILKVGSDGMSDWSPWLECKCNGRTMEMEKSRFRLCANNVDSKKFSKECDSREGMGYQSQTKPCEIRSSCKYLAYEWSQWTKCTTECGKGFHTRQRRCDPYTMACLEADRLLVENSSCEVPCEFGAVANIDIEEWIRNDPELARELGYGRENAGHLDSFYPRNSVPGFGSKVSVVTLCVSSIIILRNMYGFG